MTLDSKSWNIMFPCIFKWNCALQNLALFASLETEKNKTISCLSFWTLKGFTLCKCSNSCFNKISIFQLKCHLKLFIHSMFIFKTRTIDYMKGIFVCEMLDIESDPIYLSSLSNFSYCILFSVLIVIVVIMHIKWQQIFCSLFFSEYQMVMRPLLLITSLFFFFVKCHFFNQNSPFKHVCHKILAHRVQDPPFFFLPGMCGDWIGF